MRDGTSVPSPIVIANASTMLSKTIVLTCEPHTQPRSPRKTKVRNAICCIASCVLGHHGNQHLATKNKVACVIEGHRIHDRSCFGDIIFPSCDFLAYPKLAFSDSPRHAKQIKHENRIPHKVAKAVRQFRRSSGFRSAEFHIVVKHNPISFFSVLP